VPNFRTGDLIFLNQSTSLPVTDSNSATLQPAIYLRPATAAECTTASVAFPASWYGPMTSTPNFQWSTITGDQPPGITENYNIVGVVHTEIDPSLIELP
jgi:hypothetical protein